MPASRATSRRLSDDRLLRLDQREGDVEQPLPGALLALGAALVKSVWFGHQMRVRAYTVCHAIVRSLTFRTSRFDWDRRAPYLL